MLREKPGVIQVVTRAIRALTGLGGILVYSMVSLLGIGVPNTILVIAIPVTTPITGLIGKKK